MKTFTSIAVVVFSLIAIGHLIRFAFGWEFEVAERDVPGWVSLGAGLLAALLAVMVWRESSSRK